MPYYSFLCPHCELEFTAFKPFDKCTEKAKCERCGKPADRYYDIPNVHYTCPGFHCNDYRDSYIEGDDATRGGNPY